MRGEGRWLRSGGEGIRWRVSEEGGEVGGGVSEGWGVGGEVGG